MKVAIMQPYLFPYIDYFQLVNAVEIFVFYDDVNFIKGGFINRNNLLFNKEKTRFTMPCKSISQNKKINEIQLDLESKETQKLLTSIHQNYKKAPFFNIVYPLIHTFILESHHITISEFAMDSVKLISEYLGLNTKFTTSTMAFAETVHLDKESRLIEITKQLKASHYINSIGGVDLYNKSNFKKHEVELQFIKSKAINYKQFDNEFVPWLSIIDVLMFNNKTQILSMLNEYELV